MLCGSRKNVENQRQVLLFIYLCSLCAALILELLTFFGVVIRTGNVRCGYQNHK